MKTYLQTNYRIQRAAAMVLQLVVLLGATDLVNRILILFTKEVVANTISIFLYLGIMFFMLTRQRSAGMKLMDLWVDEDNNWHRQDPRIPLEVAEPVEVTEKD